MTAGRDAMSLPDVLPMRTLGASYTERGSELEETSGGRIVTDEGSAQDIIGEEVPTGSSAGEGARDNGGGEGTGCGWEKNLKSVSIFCLFPVNGDSGIGLFLVGISGRRTVAS